MEHKESTLNFVLSHFKGVKPLGARYMALCPCHDDRHPSLSIALGEKGVVLKCYAGCDTRDVIHAAGIHSAQLFYDHDPLQTLMDEHPNMTVVARYQYPNGAEKLRYADKHFAWRQPDGKGGWHWNRRGLAPCLYTRGDMKGVVYVVEGEKDADNLHALTQDSVVSGEDGAGPGKWKREYTAALAGKCVCVLPDNDPVGLDYAQEVAAALYGKATSVRVLDLRGAWPELPEHGDISDLIEHLGRDPDKLDGALIDLMLATPDWTPPAEPEPAPEGRKTSPEGRPMGSKAGQTGSTEPETGSKEPEPASQESREAQFKRLGLVMASEVPYQEPKWLLEPYFQRGKGTLIQGEPDAGKTAFLCAIAAAVSSGQPVLGLPVQTPGTVLLLSGEDDPHILSGRIEADGGDLRRCVIHEKKTAMTLGSPEMEELVALVQPRLLIIDPLQLYLGAKVDMHRANETRPALAALFDLCQRHDCACAIVGHTAKGAADRTPIYKSLGSADIPAAMRSILHVMKNPEDRNECAAVHIKSSNSAKGPTLGYVIGERGAVRFTRVLDLTAEDLDGKGRREPTPVPYEEEPVVATLRGLMERKPEGGFWSYQEVKASGEELFGLPPFGSVADLKSKLTDRLCKELKERDGVVVRMKQKGPGNTRGIRLERCQEP